MTISTGNTGYAVDTAYGTTTNVSITLSAGSSCVLFIVSESDVKVHVASISSSPSATWKCAQDNVVPGPESSSCEAWYADGCSSGSHTITITWNSNYAGSEKYIIAVEVTDTEGFASVNSGNWTNVNTTTTDYYTTGLCNYNKWSPSLLLGFAGNDNVGVYEIYTLNGADTLVQGFGVELYGASSVFDNGMVVARRRVTSPGQYQMTFTGDNPASGPSNHFFAALMFKETGATQAGNSVAWAKA